MKSGGDDPTIELIRSKAKAKCSRKEVTIRQRGEVLFGGG